MTQSDELLKALRSVAHRLGGNVTDVEDIKRLSGGASQETWLLTVTDSGSPEKLILRRSPFEPLEERESQAIGLHAEAELLKSLETAGIPIPRIIYVPEDTDGIGVAYIMSHIPGETLPQRILRKEEFAVAREALTKDTASALAKLHATPVGSIPDLPTSNASDQIAQYEKILRNFRLNRPVMELALKWLKANCPDAGEPALVHGDFRMGNLMIDQKGLASILDWELAHLGDPREDIGWLCTNSWRFGSPLRVGGFSDLPEFLDTYNVMAGTQFTIQDIEFWECLSSFKWGIMCLMMYETFQSGNDPSIERGSIGRRTSETEMDLINILERVS